MILPDSVWLVVILLGMLVIHFQRLLVDKLKTFPPRMSCYNSRFNNTIDAWFLWESVIPCPDSTLIFFSSPWFWCIITQSVQRFVMRLSINILSHSKYTTITEHLQLRIAIYSFLLFLWNIALSYQNCSIQVLIGFGEIDTRKMIHEKYNAIWAQKIIWAKTCLCKHTTISRFNETQT